MPAITSRIGCEQAQAVGDPRDGGDDREQGGRRVEEFGHEDRGRGAPGWTGKGNAGGAWVVASRATRANDRVPRGPPGALPACAVLGWTQMPTQASAMRTSSGFATILRTPRRRPPAVQRAVLVSTVLGSSLAFIDGAVVNVALPALQASLAPRPRSCNGSINAYLLMLGALVLVGGAAGDRYGRRRIFVVGVVLFAAASLACALAPSAALLVAARAVQGAAAALMTPASLALLGATLDDDERPRAFGIWAGAGALTTALGPVLGGWLVDIVGWRAIFLINLPLAAIAVGVAVRKRSREPRRGRAAHSTWPGALRRGARPRAR